MELKEKLEVFKKEIGYIQDVKVKSVLEKALNKVGDKFFIAPAASTGKYHPEFAQGDGGLIRHTKAIVWFMVQLFNIEQTSFDNGVPLEYNKDILIASAILHDSCKSGIKFDGAYTVFDHPILVEQLLQKEDLNEEEQKIWKHINSTIASHMGQWNHDDRSGITLPKPITDTQKFLHMVDYLASRRELDLKIFNN